MVHYRYLYLSQGLTPMDVVQAILSLLSEETYYRLASIPWPGPMSRLTLSLMLPRPRI